MTRDSVAVPTERRQEPSTVGGANDKRAGRGWAGRRVILLPLLMFLVLWLLIMGIVIQKSGPNAKNFGGDFATQLGAAQVLKDGGNPYDARLAYRTETRLLRDKQGVAVLKTPVPVGNPPLWYWALQPLTGLPFRPTAVLWCLGMYALSAIGFLASARFLGWTRRAVPLVVFLAMPQTALAAFYGNAEDLVFASFAISLLLIRRYPVIAGVLMSMAWLKPPVALPAALLIVLFLSRRPFRVILGFAIATGALAALTGIAIGWESLHVWVSALVNRSGSGASSSAYGDAATLAGLYVYWAPLSVRLVLEALSVSVAAALTSLQWLRVRRHVTAGVLSIAWLWVVWFLAAPFGHFHDEVLLALPVMAAMGINAQRAAGPLPAACLYLLALSVPLAYWTPFASNLPYNTQLHSIPLLGVAICLLAISRRPESGSKQKSADVSRDMRAAKPSARSSVP
jgi:Glycosyltransferase family 87